VQNHVMGALNGVNAVNLNKSELMDQFTQVVAPGRAGRRFAQAVAVQKQPPGCGVV